MPALTLRLPNTEVLLKRCRTLNGGLVGSRCRVDVVGSFSLDGEGALLGATGAPGEPVLDNVELDQWVDRPPVDSDGSIGLCAIRSPMGRWSRGGMGARCCW
jgi:hypothetical protein